MEIQAVYRIQLPEKLAQLTAACRGLTAVPWAARRAEEAHRLAHNLAGSGAGFGYRALGNAAHALESVLFSLRDQEAPPTTEQLDGVQACLDKVWLAAPGPHEQADVPVPALLPVFGPASAHERTIIIVDDDQDEAQRLALQLSYFGYHMHVAHTVAGLTELVQAMRPAALILDLMFPEGDLAGPAAAALLGDSEAAPPLIFLSKRTDLLARLNGVRVGGSAYFPKPVDINELVATLDRLTATTPPTPSRVLIMDDSALSARVHAAILRSAGIEVATVTDPQALLYALTEHNPDLVLMDIYLPGCTGQELAAVIRQQAAYHSMPIVFLSGETDRERQLAALGQGGDDFLTKPVRPAHLIAAVSNRLERARAIRGQMDRDSLTGLLTHAALKESLAREMARARRYSSELSVVMLDVDLFKRVNDTHGHAAGDRVLTSLARLLRQQLRSSDVVGRYGGEEFIVVLPETDSAGAFTVIDRIRAQFASVQHMGTANRPFSVTFSAGVATMAPYAAPEDVLGQADAALYGAKQRGRNCVLRADVLHGPQMAPAALAQVPAPALLFSGKQGAVREPIQALIVDDDADIRALLQHWLQGWGWNVVAVATGAEANTLLDQTTPDLVLLDALMPGLGGLDLLNLIRARKGDVGVVMVTAFSSEQLMLSALRQGADDYVRKPLDPTELRMALERTLGRLQLRREHAG